MRLLLINYELDENSGVLAWQADVVRALAKRCQYILILTQKQGVFSAPPNVDVLPVPVRPFGIPQRFGGRWLMNWEVARLCRLHKIQACFVHMAADWVFILAPVLKAMRIPILMWYAHGTVTARLKFAHTMTERVVTSTPDGFRLPSKKLTVIGQGVNTALFDIPVPDDRRNQILYIGRVSPRKRVDLLVDVMAAIREKEAQPSLMLQIIGPVLTKDDERYLDSIHDQIDRLGLQERVIIAGFVPQNAIPGYYSNAGLHINVSNTGSMDKTVVEALSCGCPVLTSNEAFRDLLKPYPEFILETDRPEEIAFHALAILQNLDAYSPIALRNLVLGRHDIESYADKIIQQLIEITHGA
jgi:glycosyltransferase involved in cell wall biosynthesis